MPINQMYRTWIRRICELRPDQRITQVRNFVWLVVGIFHSRAVPSKLAVTMYLPGREKATSRTSWPLCTSHKRGVQARAIEDMIYS